MEQQNNIPAPEINKPKSKRAGTKTVAVAPVESMRNRLEMTPRELSVVLGYSPEAYPLWIKTGRIPETAALAAECLVRRQAASDTVFFIRVVKGVPKVTMVEDVTKVTRNGKTYLEIPEG